MGMRNLLAEICRLFAIYPVKLISKKGLVAFFKTLNPINNGHQLIRIGSNSEGDIHHPRI